jgi:hypothetical protein
MISMHAPEENTEKRTSMDTSNPMEAYKAQLSPGRSGISLLWDVAKFSTDLAVIFTPFGMPVLPLV